MGADDLGTLPGQKRRGTMGHIFRATRPGHDAPPRLETVTPRAFGYRLGANACTVPAFSVLESHRSPPKSFPPFNHLQPLCPRIANRRFHNRIGRLELRFHRSRIPDPNLRLPWGGTPHQPQNPTPNPLPGGSGGLPTR